MNYRVIAKIALSLALASLSAAVCAQAPATAPATKPAAKEIAGPIEFYPHETQIGIVAKREIKQDGRTVAITYYRAKNRPATKESDLIEAETIRISYDEKGRSHREQSSVGSVQETQYNDDNSIRTITWYRAPGKPRNRNIYANGSCKTELHYNHDGIVSCIRGVVLPDNDLPAWGQTVDNVACGLLTTSARGTFSSMGLWITARNDGKDAKQIVTIGKSSPAFLVEVRRADGTLVPQDPDYLKKRSETVVNPNKDDVAQTLDPGKAQLVAWGRELSNWYPTLAPGKYQVTVTCRSGEEFNIVSNTAKFEIIAPAAR